ncbi:MAG: 1-acyl-sn-glycerol-3-phosphate acyltransferase [Clostridiales bacterium]|nr:1-acyl-sn-glycerol-3-phosphate acyltransferase [Clostridiales bacterium]
MLYVYSVLSIISSFSILYFTGYLKTWHLLWRVPLIAVGCFLALVLLFLLVVYSSTLFVDMRKKQDKPSSYFRFLLNQFSVVTLTFAGVHVHTSGLDKVPRGSRFMLVCNHRFFIDPLIFYYAMPWADLAFIAKKEAFKIPIVSQVMHEVLCLPIDRDNDREALKTILKAIELLKQNKASIAVFPEGGTNRTGEMLLPFRNGAFKIAQKAQVPIVVCALTNSGAIKKNMFRRRTDVYLDVIDVLQPDDFCAEKTPEIGEQTRKIMASGISARQTALA